MRLEKLAEYCGDIKAGYVTGECMAYHTSFKIGGPADIFITASSKPQLSALLKKCKELDVPYMIIGKGSNLLVSDQGIEGAVISLAGIDFIRADGERIMCGAGAALSEVCRAALDNSLSGLEFAYGIPGSVGGAIYMNAGAYGGQMSDVVISAECVNSEGETVFVEASQMELGYRTSLFRRSGLTVVSAELGLEKADKAGIEEKMNDFISRRKSKQPLEYPSGGSFFKRPEGNFAGALIEKCGLKGFSVGGAAVSEKHAGFIINKGGATCDDVVRLGRSVSDRVFEKEGIRLEPEVILIGRSGKNS